MQILDYDELSSGMQTQVHLLDLSAGWGMADFQRVDEARRMKYPAPDYFGVFAVEGGEVLSMVRVLRLPYTTPRGPMQIAAIQGVVTRRDRAREGLARKLLEEVHRRERIAGSRFSLLWTGRVGVAHRLYEKLGYSDVYTPEIAVRHCAKSAKPKGYGLEKLRTADAGILEEIHTVATKGRLGFTPRPSGLIPSVLNLGFLSLDSLKLIIHGNKPVGYAAMQKSQGWLRLDELVTLDQARPTEVISLLESEASGGWLAIRNTAVRDLLGTLQARGYGITHLAYYSLLAKALDGHYPVTPKTLGITNRSFSCQGLDYF